MIVKRTPHKSTYTVDHSGMVFWIQRIEPPVAWIITCKRYEGDPSLTPKTEVELATAAFIERKNMTFDYETKTAALKDLEWFLGVAQ